MLRPSDILGLTVGHNEFGQSMEIKEVREEERGKGGSVNIGGGGDEVTHFGEDGVVAVASHGESSDEVHGDAFPRFEGDALMASLHHLALLA